MPMHTPSRWIFLMSLVLVVLAVLSVFVRIPFVTQYAVWFAVVGWLALAIGCIFKTA